MECPWPDTFRFCWRAVYVTIWCLLLLFPLGGGEGFDRCLPLLLFVSSLKALCMLFCRKYAESCHVFQPRDPRSKLEQKTHQSFAGYKYSKAIIKPYRAQCTHCFARLYECIRKTSILAGAGDPRERTLGLSGRRANFWAVSQVNAILHTPDETPCQ